MYINILLCSSKTIFRMKKTELIIRSNSSDIDFALLKDGKLIELK